MVKFVDRRPTIDGQLARAMITYIDENGPLKPWTLVHEVAESDIGHDADYVWKHALNPLVKRGVLTPNANGDIRVLDRELLDKILDNQ